MPENLETIFDTSSLIFLDHLGYLSKVNQHHDIVTTPDVIWESNQKGGRAGLERGFATLD